MDEKKLKEEELHQVTGGTDEDAGETAGVYNENGNLYQHYEPSYSELYDAVDYEYILQDYLRFN